MYIFSYINGRKSNVSEMKTKTKQTKIRKTNADKKNNIFHLRHFFQTGYSDKRIIVFLFLLKYKTFKFEFSLFITRHTATSTTAHLFDLATPQR